MSVCAYDCGVKRQRFDRAAVEASTDEGSGATLAIVAGLLTLAGLGLFALRWSARRFGTS